jgi:hypothetical protein
VVVFGWSVNIGLGTNHTATVVCMRQPGNGFQGGVGGGGECEVCSDDKCCIMQRRPNEGKWPPASPGAKLSHV